MAKTTVVTITDDIDGSSDDVVTCAFGLGGDQFEIDLNADHREELENFLSRFIEHARLVKGAGRRQQRSLLERSLIVIVHTRSANGRRNRDLRSASVVVSARK
jgi:hypothetical protein